METLPDGLLCSPRPSVRCVRRPERASLAVQPHDWRHAAAVWQLFALRLDREDVAAHLGQSDGYTLYQLWVGARPGRASRAARAAEDAGGPRR